MSAVSIRELLEAGVHFGHQTKRWNPKMKPYIFGQRNGIYIIDLQKTQRLFRQVTDAVQQLCAQGKTLLFVGTKRQAQEAIAEEAGRCDMFHVTQRWLGGLLTNFATVRRSIERLRDLDGLETDPKFQHLTKKERLKLEKERARLQKVFAGIKSMARRPDLIFVVDTKREAIAVAEANKLGIPVIGIVDTNADPDPIDYPIPGNDDAIRAIRLIASRIADAAMQGRLQYRAARGEAPDGPRREPRRAAGPDGSAEPAPPRARAAEQSAAEADEAAALEAAPTAAES